MLTTRIIPVLLLRRSGLYKTKKFRDPKYVGDPINAVKIFNDKEVDEIIVLDVEATAERREPDYARIEDIASECFMPLCYGGGINSVDQMRHLQRIGVEKVCLNSAAFRTPELVQAACDTLGASSVVASIDARRSFLGRNYEVCIDAGRTNTKVDPIAHAKRMAELGVGEILINSIDRDGTMGGYDVELVSRVSSSVDVPVIACGGCGSIEDMRQVVQEGGVSAVAAGSVFVFHGKHRAVLINYPTGLEIPTLQS
jgi:cyclase